MEGLVLHALKRVGEAWHNASALWFGLVGAAIVGAYAALIQPLSGLSIGFRWGFACALPVAFVFVWLWSNWIPRSRKGRIGVVIAIAAENDAQERRVRLDFINRLHDQLLADPDKTRLHLIVYPKFIAERIETAQDARRYAAKSRAGLIVYGHVEDGTVRGVPHHFVSLHGIVGHRSENSEIRKELRTDFAQVLPEKVVLSKDGDVLHFEVISEMVDFSVRYITGLAALISGNAPYAEQMLLDARKHLPEKTKRQTQLRGLEKRVAYWLTLLYTSWMNHLLWQFVLKRKGAFVEQAEPIIDKLLALAPNDYAGHIAKAVCDFVLRRDVASAKGHLRLVRTSRDVTWRFSLAFLFAYEGRLDRAAEEYDHAFQGRFDRMVPTDSEEFINCVLTDEPSLVQLKYCTAVLNLFGKNDPDAAIIDLDAFLADSASEQWPKARERALKLRERAAREAATTEWEVPDEAPVTGIFRDIA